MKANKTFRSLLLSVLSLLLCCTMLIGSTFAWFTDSVTSSNNIIKSGNLDVELYYQVEGQTDWTKVDENTNIFMENALWEPGHTEVVKLKVTNEGSLSLKYKLGINIASETASINKAGEAFKLSDYIKYGIVDGAQDYTRDAAVDAVDATAVAIKTAYNPQYTELLSGKEQFFTVVVYMPTSVGNEANHKTGAAQPNINLGINLFATQKDYETDSFGPDYDINAPHETVSTPAELAEVLTAAASAGAGDTVIVLTKDIDLTGIAWTPIEVDGYNGAGIVTINGNNNTIKGLTAPLFKGGFAGKSGIVINDLTIADSAIVSTSGLGGGAFVDTADSMQVITLNNCHLVDSTVSGERTGGLIGWCSGYAKLNDGPVKTYVTIKDCSVVNSTIIADGSAGAIAGHPGASDYTYTTIEDCLIDNVDVVSNSTESWRTGAVVGTANNGHIVIKNVRIDDVTLTQNGESRTSNEHICGRFVPGETGTLEIDGVATVAKNNTELKNAIAEAQNGDVVAIGEGEFTLTSLAGKSGVTIEGDPNGGTKVAAVNSFNFGEDTTIKNVTFKTSGSNSVRYGTTTGEVTFDNCVFEGKQYAMHIDNANNGTVIFNDCTFYGRNAFASSGEYVFNNCTFKYTYSNYNTINLYSKATFNNCYWDSDLELYLENGAEAVIDGDKVTENVLFISDARKLESFQFAVNGGKSFAGKTVMLSADIDMNDAYYDKWFPVGQTGATQFMGTFDGHGYTIKNLNIDSTKQTGANYSSGLFGWLNNATVKNLNIENATVKGNHNVGVIAGYLETAGCTISNCNVTNATVEAYHANDDACGDKCGVIVGHAGNAGVKVTDCSAKNSTVTAGRDAGQIAGAALTANVTGCTAENVTVSATGECTGANINNAVIGRVLG